MVDLRTASVFSRRCLRRRLRWLAVLGLAVASLLYCWPGHPSAHGLAWPDVAANEQGALTTYAGAERVLEQMLTVYAQAVFGPSCRSSSRAVGPVLPRANRWMVGGWQKEEGVRVTQIVSSETQENQR